MELTFTTPVQIFINDKWFCTAQEVNISEKKIKPQEGITPRSFTGTIINIKKHLPRTDKEKEQSKKVLRGVESYDEFFRRMVDAVDNPNLHTPVDMGEGWKKGKV